MFWKQEGGAEELCETVCYYCMYNIYNFNTLPGNLFTVYKIRQNSELGWICKVDYPRERGFRLKAVRVLERVLQYLDGVFSAGCRSIPRL
jgi:hypothetical protein